MNNKKIYALLTSALLTTNLSLAVFAVEDIATLDTAIQSTEDTIANTTTEQVPAVDTDITSTTAVVQKTVTTLDELTTSLEDSSIGEIVIENELTLSKLITIKNRTTPLTIKGAKLICSTSSAGISIVTSENITIENTIQQESYGTALMVSQSKNINFSGTIEMNDISYSNSPILVTGSENITLNPIFQHNLAKNTSTSVPLLLIKDTTGLQLNPTISNNEKFITKYMMLSGCSGEVTLPYLYNFNKVDKTYSSDAEISHITISSSEKTVSDSDITFKIKDLSKFDELKAQSVFYIREDSNIGKVNVKILSDDGTDIVSKFSTSIETNVSGVRRTAYNIKGADDSKVSTLMSRIMELYNNFLNGNMTTADYVEFSSLTNGEFKEICSLIYSKELDASLSTGDISVINSIRKQKFTGTDGVIYTRGFYFDSLIGTMNGGKIVCTPTTLDVLMSSFVISTTTCETLADRNISVDVVSYDGSADDAMFTYKFTPAIFKYMADNNTRIDLHPSTFYNSSSKVLNLDFDISMSGTSATIYKYLRDNKDTLEVTIDGLDAWAGKEVEVYTQMESQDKNYIGDKTISEKGSIDIKLDGTFSEAYLKLKEEVITKTVTIKHVDEATGKELDTEVIPNVSLGKHTYKAKSIKGYSVVGDIEETIELKKDSENPTITFKYKAVVANDNNTNNNENNNSNNTGNNNNNTNNNENSNNSNTDNSNNNNTNNNNSNSNDNQEKLPDTSGTLGLSLAINSTLACLGLSMFKRKK